MKRGTKILTRCMSKSSWMMDPARSSEMPSCSTIDLAEIRRSSKISPWIWSIISGMVTILVRPGREAAQVEKSPLINWATQFLTVAYHGARSPNVSVRMACIFFGTLACREKTWWQLTSRRFLNRSCRLTCFLSAFVTRRDLQFGTWTDPLFPTTLSISSYDMGKYVGLRTIQHPFYIYIYIEVYNKIQHLACIFGLSRELRAASVCSSSCSTEQL